MTHMLLPTQTQKSVLVKQNNILGLNHSSKILELVNGSNFPWFYYSDVHRVNPKHRQEWNISRHCFVHQFWFDNQQWSQHFSLFEPLVYKMADVIGVEYVKTLRMQANMMLNVGKSVYDVEHVDGFAYEETDELQWFTGIYYINNSDGDTSIHLPDGQIEKVTPVADSVVVFDGKYTHSGQLPLENNVRIVVNVNFLGKKL